MATLPGARTRISAEASALAGGTGYCAVFACVPNNADIKPRVFSTWKAAYALHGYARGVDYVSLHIERTRLPVIFIGLPIDTPGAISDSNDSAVEGTCTITAVATTPEIGVLDEVDGRVEVLSPGTVGTLDDGAIVLAVSVNGGRTSKRVRLGAAASYAIPYFGVTLNFGTGNLLTGDVFTFKGSAPKYDSDDLTAGKDALAAQLKQTRSWLIAEDVADSTAAGVVLAAVNAYETEIGRFALARVNVADKPSGDEMSDWVSDQDAEFSDIDDEPRIDIGLGRGWKLSPITGAEMRRPVSWAASIREYERDIHQTTWEKEAGPLSGWSLEDTDNNVTEYDERLVGGALAARFTCFRTWANGPAGAFIAQSLTRADENTVLSMTHNEHVANLACTVVQITTENFVGKTPQVDSAGHMLSAPRGQLEARVNTALAAALLKEHVPGAGPRASSAVWRMSTDDILNVPDATVTGVCTLNVNGTIVNVDTLVKVS